MSKNYLIDHIDVNKSRLEVFACKKFKKQYQLDDFFAEYDDDIDLGKIDYSILQIPFLLNVIPIIWLFGEEYHIEQMDENLAHSLQEVREAFQTMHPNIAWNGELIGDKLVSNTQAIQHVNETTDDSIGVLFSGGVDSVYTSFRHIDKPQVLISIWGGNVALENESGWAITRDQCKQFGLLYGHENAFIKSNFSRFLYTSLLKTRLKSITGKILNWWLYAQYGLGLTGLTAPLLFGRRSKKLFISSAGRDYQEPHAARFLKNSRLVWAGISVTDEGIEFPRQEKIGFIKGFCEDQKKPKPTLNVCFSDTRIHGDNCCRCEKCLRTITGLLIEGGDIQYYGFNITHREALTIIRDKFRTLSMPMGPGPTSVWENMQLRAREVLSGSNSCDLNDDTVIQYLQWLTSLDLQEYIIRYEEKSKPNYLITVIKQIVKALMIHFPILGRTFQKKKEQYYYHSACKK